MNIFVTDISPKCSAIALDDKRLIKMILESAQMLSTAMHEIGAPNPPYKATHRNHPCSIWARTTSANYLWLLEHMTALSLEYSVRYNREHKCHSFIDVFLKASNLIPHGALTPFANCTPYKDMETSEAYRKYMLDKWREDENKKRKATWTNSQKPMWAN